MKAPSSFASRRPPNRRASVQFLMGAVIGLMAVTIATAQTPPRVVNSAASGGALRLHWTGTAPSYAVQGTPSLTAPDWQPLLLTARTNATIPLPGGTGFFRVQALNNSGDLEISDDRRLEILDAIGRKIESLPGTNDVVESRELASFVSSHAEFIGVGVVKDTSVWARFRDGRLLFIINNRPPATDEELEQVERLISTASTAGASSSGEAALASAAVSLSRPAPHAITRAVRPTGLPESRNAVLFQATGVGLSAPAFARLAPAFRARGYQVQGGEAGLFELMAVKELGDDIGVFYIDTHGVSVEGVIPFALLTSTPVDSENHGRLRDNFARGEVAYVVTGPKIRPKRPGIVVTPKPLYCVLPPFVPAYWKFGRNSLVYVDVCDSASPDAATFIERCAEAGASVYMGWTDTVDDAWALYAAGVFLGTSMGDREHLIKTATPTRSFDWPAIASYMASRRINISPRSNAELILFADTPSANGRFGLLTPSIYSMNVDEAREELRIVGLFDSEVPATVRIEGNGVREVTVPVRPNSSTLHPWQIVCPLPAREQPTAGLVTVIQRGRASNPVPLTEWRVEARGKRWFSPGFPDLFSTVDFQLHFRADVHPSRSAPYQVPVFLGTSAAASRASTARVVEASGIYTDVNASNPNFVRTVEWSLPGPIDLPITYTGFGTVDRAFHGTLGIARDGNSDLVFTSKAANDMTVIETQISPSGRSELRYPGDPGVRIFPPGKTRLDFTTYALESGTGPAAGDSGQFGWGEASASFPPEPKTAASQAPAD